MRSRLAGALLLGLVAGAGVLWWQRAAVAEVLAQRILAARGVPASLRVVRIDLGGLELAELRIGNADAPDLDVAQIALAWSWRGLRERRLERVELSGVRLRARLGEDGIELGTLDALRGEGGAAGAAALPFKEAQFRDVEVAFESARGPLVLRAEGQVATRDPRSREVAGSAEANGATPFGSGAVSLRLSGTLDAPRVTFSGKGTPDEAALGARVTEPVTLEGSASWDEAGALVAHVTLGLKQAELPGVAQLTGVAIDANLAGDAVEATVRVAKLVELSLPPLVAPLSVEAKLTGSLEQLAFRGQAKTGGDGFTLSFDGTLERARPRLSGTRWMSPAASRSSSESSARISL